MELLAAGKDIKGLTPVTARNADGSATVKMTGSTTYHPELRLTAVDAASVARGLTAPMPPPPNPTPEPNPNPTPLPLGVLWAWNGDLAGPTNNPFIEAPAYSGAEWNTGNKHPRVDLVTSGPGFKPIRKYAYRYTLGPGKNAFDNIRLELAGQAQSYDPAVNPDIPQIAKTWTGGEKLWVPHAYTNPAVNKNDPAWSEDSQGCTPVVQFHGNGSVDPPWGLRITGTRPGFTPKFQLIGSAVSWEDSLAFVDGVRYRFMWHFEIAKNGFLEGWIARGDGASWQQIISEKGVNTLPGTYTYPCMGGPKIEANNPGGQPEPETETFYHECFSFCETREAAEVALT